MKKHKKIKLLLASFLIASLNVVNASVIDFEDVIFTGNWMSTPSIDGQNDWRSNDVVNFYFDSSYGGYSWNGFKASRATVNTPKNYTNDCCSVMGGGSGGSSQYAVLYAFTTDFNYTTNYSFLFDNEVVVESIDITNTAYAWNSLSQGDGFAKSIYTVSGEAYFSLFIRGIKSDGYTDYLEITLASKNSTGDVFILDSWDTFSLTAINDIEGGIYGLDMYLGSSQNLAGSYGINTPTYVAFDNIVYSSIPEPATYAVLLGILALGFVSYKNKKRKKI